MPYPRANKDNQIPTPCPASHPCRLYIDRCIIKFIEIKPLVLTQARQSQVTKIAVKQLLLWSHKTQCNQGVKNFREIKPLVQIHARQSQVTKIGRKTTSALEPQNSVYPRPGREHFSEIKPLVLTHARQSQVTKIGRKTTSALEPQSTFI